MSVVKVSFLSLNNTISLFKNKMFEVLINTVKHEITKVDNKYFSFVYR